MRRLSGIEGPTGPDHTGGHEVTKRRRSNTAKCPYCRKTVNRLALYATGIGSLCYGCLRVRPNGPTNLVQKETWLA